MWYKVIFVFNWEGIAMHPRSQVMSSVLCWVNTFASTRLGVVANSPKQF